MVEELQFEREYRVNDAQKATVVLQSYINEVCQQNDEVCRDIAGHVKKIDNTKKQ